VFEKICWKELENRRREAAGRGNYSQALPNEECRIEINGRNTLIHFEREPQQNNGQMLTI
jgi:hypothetical protein